MREKHLLSHPPAGVLTLSDILNKFENLYTGAISDILCSMGHRGAMDPQIRPLFEDIRIVGRAHTIRAAPTSAGTRSIAVEAKAACRPGDFVVIDMGGSCESTIWGENSSVACKIKGAVGVVIDGPCRDVAAIRRIRFPVYCRAVSPGIRKGAIVPVAYGVPVSCGGVKVNPGDLLFGDDDGVVVIPSEVEGEVVTRTLSFVKKDKAVRDALMAGMDVKEAYRLKHGK